MGGDEIKFVQEAFDSNWISPVGPHISTFEQKLASYVGVAHCAALSSGTAAIHLALIILGVKAGDEVICSTFTFSGSCNPIVYLGAEPVFVDSESDTWNMDPCLLEQVIEDRIKHKGSPPKAIILVHLYGMPAKMEQLMGVAKKFNIPVIEDAAEALGSMYKGKYLGSFGELGVLSFNGNKIITTSGGGALVSNNHEFIEKARFLATQARDPAPHYEHSHIGYNYRLSNVCAGIGLGQMGVLNQRVEQRRRVFWRYTEKLSKLKGLSFLNEVQGSFSNRWLTTILVESTNNQHVTRDSIRLALEDRNIESRPLWKPMHLQPVFKNYPHYSNGCSESLFQRGLCLPSGSNLTEEQQDIVINTVMDLFT